MKIVTVVGARPQFIKAAGLSPALRTLGQEMIIHTGQHYDERLSAIFFQDLRLPSPNYNLGIGSATHAKQTAGMLEGIEPILLAEKPDFMLVYGDTNSTLAGSLAAAKLNIPIIHVESGLRSYNRAMPEELNRIITDHLSTLLFCPTPEAVDNLAREGIHDRVYLVGDIMYDCLLAHKDIALRQSAILDQLKLAPKQYCAATIHRGENTDSPHNMNSILDALGQLDCTVVLPLHPRTSGLIRKWGLEHKLKAPRILVTDPLSYLDMLCLTCNAKLVLTDSGGLQKEAYMLQVPCLTLRNETEWIETVAAGWNRLTGADTSRIVHAFNNLAVPDSYPPIFGDGNTAEQIRRHLEQYMKA